MRLSLPVDAKGLAEARSALAAWLERNGVAEAQVDDVLIAANEACMNAVEHSGAPGDSKIEMSAGLDGARLSVEVTDRGRWREPVPTDDRGHGLGLMRKLMDHVDIDHDGEGTRVLLKQTLVFGAPGRREPRPAEVELGEVRGVSVAIIGGEVDLAAVERLGAALEAASDAAVDSLVLDLTDVSYLDSSGVHLLFKLAHRRKANGGVLRIAVPAGPVRRVLELIGVEATLGLDETVDEAIARV